MTRKNDKGRSLDDLLVDFRAAAQQHGIEVEQGDHRRANAAYERGLAIAKEIKARGADGEQALIELLNADSASVRGWAAFNLLASQPALAEAALERIASGPPGFTRLSAEMTLEEWRAGRLKATQ